MFACARARAGAQVCVCVRESVLSTRLLHACVVCVCACVKRLCAEGTGGETKMVRKLYITNIFYIYTLAHESVWYFDVRVYEFVVRF